MIWKLGESSVLQNIHQNPGSSDGGATRYTPDNLPAPLAVSDTPGKSLGFSRPL
jgi:hypothetical protein